MNNQSNLSDYTIEFVGKNTNQEICLIKAGDLETQLVVIAVEILIELYIIS